MRTNIERVMNHLIHSNLDITLANAFPLYLQEVGFGDLSVDALVAFEHALDKYPTRTDESQTLFVKGICGITTEYWTSKCDALASMPCSHCDAHARQMSELGAGAVAEVNERRHPEEEQKIPKPRVKSKKKERRVRARREGLAARFDPFAPSTSDIRM